MIDVKLWETLSKLESDIIKRKCFRHNESEREAILSAANLLPLMIEICDNNKFEDNNHRIAYLTSAANNRLTEYLAEQYKRESFETTEDNPYERAECSTANAEDLLFTKIEGVSSSAEEKLKERVKNYQPGDSYIDIIVKLGKTPKTVDFIKEALLQGKETKKEIVAFLDAEFPDHKYKKSNVSALASKIRRDEGLSSVVSKDSLLYCSARYSVSRLLAADVKYAILWLLSSNLLLSHISIIKGNKFAADKIASRSLSLCLKHFLFIMSDSNFDRVSHSLTSITFPPSCYNKDGIFSFEPARPIHN